jgi:ankyrin repeat protein
VLFRSNLEITQLLLARGAKVNVHLKPTGDTPLHVAARHGHTTVGELLLANGAKVNSRGGSFNGYTPLHRAVKSGHTAMVELLIQKGANVNSNAVAKTPLFKAVRNRDTVMAELLLAHGANVNANQTNWPRRYTLLELAKQQGDNDMIKLLKQHGAEE